MSIPPTADELLERPIMPTYPNISTPIIDEAMRRVIRKRNDLNYRLDQLQRLRVEVKACELAEARK